MAASFRQLLPEALNLFRRGRLPEAEKTFREILAVRPREADALLPLALICGHARNFSESIDLLQRLLTLKPYSREGLGNLGAMYASAGRHAEAIATFLRFLTLHPDHPPTLLNLGISYKAAGQLPEAVDALRRAIACKPDYVEALIALGSALAAQHLHDEAIAAYHAALRINPQNADAHHNLGLACKHAGKFQEALDHFRRAMTLRPNFLEAAGALGNVLRDSGQVEEALTLSRFLLQHSPNDLQNRANFLFTLQYADHLSPAEIFHEHQRWGPPPEGYFPNAAQLPHTNDRSPHRRLRIGYVSPDFRSHSVAFFLEPLLAAHDPASVEIFCYASVSFPDAVTARLRALAHHWHDVASLPDQQLADLIRHDAIDILVDLAGHTLGARLAPFALKPAPIQISYLGYPDTTGVPQIDYRFTDALADPPGMTDAHLTEKLVRLSQTFLAYAPPADAPRVSPPPVITRGAITFGSFNVVSKISPHTITLWVAILHAVPNSRLLLKAKNFGPPYIQQRLTTLFGTAGITSDRLIFRDLAPTIPDHLASYADIDIALDTFPYHGTTTTCEALWMGVPVVTLAGKRHAARVGVSLLTNVGLREFIAETDEQYTAIAVALANDHPRLTMLRTSLRDRLQSSPLMDYSRFAADVEAAYSRAWQQYCATSTQRAPG